VRERPLQFRVVPGQGPMVGWRQGSPPRGMQPNAPEGIHDPSADRVRRTQKEVRAHAPGRVSVPSDGDAESGALASRWTSVVTPWSAGGEDHRSEPEAPASRTRSIAARNSRWSGSTGSVQSLTAAPVRKGRVAGATVRFPEQLRD